jgi:hypothetical protein
MVVAFRIVVLSGLLGGVAFLGARFGLANLFTAIDLALLSASLSFLWHLVTGLIILVVAGGLIHFTLKCLRPERREFGMTIFGGLVWMNVLSNFF